MSRARIGLHAATQLLSIAHAHEALASLRLGRAQADIIFDGKAPMTVSKMNQTANYDALEKWLEIPLICKVCIFKKPDNSIHVSLFEMQKIST